ncbi:L,D-transpeptidase [Actinocorallia longicatena]
MVAAVCGVVLLAGCSSTPEKATKVDGVERTTAGAAAISISPRNAATGVAPDKGVVVRSADGTLDDVKVSYQGQEIPGEFSPDRTAWKASDPLAPSAEYTVTATARNPDGKVSTETSTFKTLKPAKNLQIIDITPMPGEKVGVGMPVIVKFNRTVTDKKAVERMLVVKTTKASRGAWFWTVMNGVQTAIFRPPNGKYWPANTKIAFAAKLKGVRSGKGIYGIRNYKQIWKIGDAHYIVASAKTHRLRVYKNKKLITSWPISMGSGGDVWPDGIDHQVTTSGYHLTMAHSKLERMRPPGKKKGDPGWYDEKVPWATRISASGEYIHQNMDDPSCLGNRNCSHGCVRSPADKAKWFMNWSYRGDIVKITGTSRPLAWNNGWGFYQLSWKAWVKGSALKRVVSTRV